MNMSPSALDAVRATGLMAIVRGVRADLLVPTIEGLVDVGLRAVEVTLDTPGALEAVAACQVSIGELAAIGCGTVRTKDEAHQAIDAGATFLVSPHTDPEILRTASQQSIETFPGALTSTEIITAWQAGATAVKVFPIGTVGGVEYLHALRAPLHDIPLLAVGGVLPNQVAEYRQAGATGVGLGSNLISSHLVNDGRLAEALAIAHIAVREAAGLTNV